MPNYFLHFWQKQNTSETQALEDVVATNEAEVRGVAMSIHSKLLCVHVVKA